MLVKNQCNLRSYVSGSVGKGSREPINFLTMVTEPISFGKNKIHPFFSGKEQVIGIGTLDYNLGAHQFKVLMGPLHVTITPLVLYLNLTISLCNYYTLVLYLNLTISLLALLPLKRGREEQ